MQQQEISVILNATLSYMYEVATLDAFAREIYFAYQEQPHDGLPKIDAIIEQLKQSRPIQYILGVAYFWDRTFKVNKHTLIPRSETEELIYWIKESYKNKPHPTRILDLGTGSGCIALTLKSIFPNAHVTGMDISKDTLALAQQNDIQQQVHWIQDDILQPSPQLSTQVEWDLIVSNPPYISADEMKDMHTNVLAYEPHLALFVAHNDVQQFYKAIATFSAQHIHTSGSVYLELNAMHALATKQVFEEKGFVAIIKKDMQYKDRMLCANWPNSTIEL